MKLAFSRRLGTLVLILKSKKGLWDSVFADWLDHQRSESMEIDSDLQRCEKCPLASTGVQVDPNSRMSGPLLGEASIKKIG